MRPILLKPGDEIFRAGRKHTYVFIKRISAERSPSGRAKNIFQCDVFRGLDGPEDQGIVEMSDYDVSRRCQRKPRS